MKRLALLILALTMLLCVLCPPTRGAEVLTPGFLKLSLYTNITGTAVSDLTSDPGFPGSPSEVRYLRSFNTRDALPTDALQDYGSRIEGFLTPLESGDYNFFLRSDRSSELWLSSDATEANASPIASQTAYGNAFMEPDSNDPTTSQPVSLTAGKRYFIMVLYKATSGGGASADYAQVAWRKVGETNPPAALLKPIPAAYLSTMASDAGGPKITITKSPADLTAEENSSVTFTVAATVSPTNYVCIQWQRNGVNIPGATGASYTRFLDKADQGAKFRAVVAVPGASMNSAEATVTVTDDKTVPKLLGAKGGPNRPEVTLTFSERVSSASATALSNYKITSSTGVSLGIAEASLSADQTQVKLTTDAPSVGTQYTITVNNIKDLAAAGSNTVPANSQATFYALGPWLQGDDGFVIWEAEDYDRNLDGRWFATTERGVASGGVAMVNWNGAGGNENNTKLEYDIYFTKPGTNIFWYRVSANDGNDDSFWLHLDGVRVPGREAGNLDAMTGFNTSLQSAWSWNSSPYEGGGRATFVIDTPGLHSIGIALREDGAFVDKFLITTDPNFNPTTTFGTFGPPVTLRQGEPAPPAVADFAITLQPVNTQGQENTTITLSAAAAIPAGYLYSYQWQRKQGNSFVDIAGAVATSLTISPLTWDWNGTSVRMRIIVGGVTKYTSEATITVLTDSTPPTVSMPFQPRVTTTPDQVILMFNEVVAKASAETVANYAITTDTGSLAVQSAALGTDGRTLTLTTASQTAGKTYTVTVNNVTDIAAKPNPIAPNSKLSFFYAGISDKFAQRADGYVIMEAEHATRNTPATDGDEWLFRNSPAGFSGTGYMVVPNGRGGGNVGAGALLEYDIRFTQTGVHTLWIRGWNQDPSNSGSDDSVYVAFDGTALGSGNDAAISGFPAAGWTWSSDRYGSGLPDPATINVTTTGVHTLALWHREDGTLIDKIVIEAGNRGSTTAAPAPATAYNGLGEGETWDFQVAPPAAPTVTLTSPTSNQTFAANSSIAITAQITAPSPITLVEFFQGTNLLGQTTSAPYSFTMPNVPEGIYNVRVRVTDTLGYLVTATAASLVVDSTKPVMQAVASSFDGRLIGVLFREQVSGLDPVTATNTANYQINNGAVAVMAATLQPDNTTVLLTPATPVTGPFTVKAQNVADLGFGPNVIDATTLTGNVVVSALQARDVGTPNTNDPVLFSDPVMPGFTLALNATDFYIAAGGSDIWNLADGCHFLYQEKTGDFDVATRVESLTRPNEWAKASLMVREDLDGNSRNSMILVSPPAIGQPAGVNVFNVQWRDVKGGTTVSLATAQRPTPVPYPNAWLRLQRTGDTYNAYYGTNGVDWTLLNTYATPATNPYPAKTYVGIAVTSRNNGTNAANTVRALVRDLKGFGAAVLPTAGPSLAIKRVGANVEISWASDSGQFVLQSAASLPAAYWQTVGIPPIANGAGRTVTVPIGSTTQFFRLLTP